MRAHGLAALRRIPAHVLIPRELTVKSAVSVGFANENVRVDNGPRGVPVMKAWPNARRAKRNRACVANAVTIAVDVPPNAVGVIGSPVRTRACVALAPLNRAAMQNVSTYRLNAATNVSGSPTVARLAQPLVQPPVLWKRSLAVIVALGPVAVRNVAAGLNGPPAGVKVSVRQTKKTPWPAEIIVPFKFGHVRPNANGANTVSVAIVVNVPLVNGKRRPVAFAEPVPGIAAINVSGMTGLRAMPWGLVRRAVSKSGNAGQGKVNVPQASRRVRVVQRVVGTILGRAEMNKDRRTKSVGMASMKTVTAKIWFVLMNMMRRRRTTPVGPVPI